MANATTGSLALRKATQTEAANAASQILELQKMAGSAGTTWDMDEMGLHKLNDEIVSTDAFRSDYAKCFIDSMREEGIAGMTGLGSPSAEKGKKW
jgi:hypothetical protein